MTQIIVAAARRIAAGSREQSKLGNIEVQRDWGRAPEHVEAMWLMLQQATPADFVIATGETHSLREFVAEAFGALGSHWTPHVSTDSTLIRPSEIMLSRGDPRRASFALGWVARTRLAGVVRKMVDGESDARNG